MSVSKITIISDSSQIDELRISKLEIITHIERQLHDTVEDYSGTHESRYYNEAMTAIKMLIDCGRKIHAIKLLRAFFPIGLKEAKDYVESF